MDIQQLLEIKSRLEQSVMLIDELIRVETMETSQPITQSIPTVVELVRTPIQLNLSVDIDDPEWPTAIPESSIVLDESKKWVRANTVLTHFGEMKGPILDFGCGEGHMTITLRDQGIKCVGYDIQNSDAWNLASHTNNTFITDWDTVLDNGPYKSVLLHDVVDHVQNNTIEEVMLQVSECLDDEGMVYIMTHPYSSRHGGHLYTTVNKAYLHLLLSDEQIANNFPDVPFNQCVIKPQGKYQAYFTENFTILNKKVATHALEPWISHNLLPLIHKRWYPDLTINQVEKVMQLSGMYYTLKKLSHTI